MSYTMEDFRREYAKEHFKDLTPEEQREVLQSLSPEQRIEGLSVEELERLLNQLKTAGASRPRRSRKKRTS